MSLRAKTKYVASGRPAARAGLSLHCSKDAVACHWIRLVLAEKEISDPRIIWQLPGELSDELLHFDPDGHLPTLVDRDVVIHPAHLIATFIDERYPHPPMMPPEAETRARLRMFMLRFETRWLALLAEASRATPAQKRKLHATLFEELAACSRLFPARGWFMGQPYGLADAALSALLWRMATLKLDLPKTLAPVLRYAERAFARPSFANSQPPGAGAKTRGKSA